MPGVTVPPGEAHAAYGMAGLLGAGGAFAFLARGSKSSLLASLLFAVPYVAAGELVRKGDAKQGHALGAVTGLALSGGMTLRYFSTGKFMPAGAIAAVAIASGGYHLNKYFIWAE